MTVSPLSTTARLTASGVEKRFGATTAVAGVDLSIAAGEVRALVGENGAGKSTLVKILSGVIAPDRGTLSLDGAAYRPAGTREARERGVVLVHQELALAPHLSVSENVFLGMEPVRRGRLLRDVMRTGTARALSELEHDDISPDARVSSLSIAKRQVVELARAMILDARVLILDEPTSSLSRPDVEVLFALIERLKRRGIAIVYISHFLEEVWRVADTFTVLRDGRSVSSGRIADATIADIVHSMVGRDVRDLYPRSSRERGEVVLEVEGLSGVDKPVDASFTLHRGEVLGIAGLMGAGRTELARTIFGLDAVRSGRIRVGAFAGPASPRERLRQGLGLLSEDRQGEGVLLSRSVAENITLSRIGRFTSPRALAEASRPLIEQLSIDCHGPAQRVDTLSGGNQQKVALARLLHHGLDVLLLDEPTRGIDVGSKAEIYRLVDRLALGGKAVLLISSDLSELLGMSDRVAIMSRGRMSEPRAAAELDEATLLREAIA